MTLEKLLDGLMVDVEPFVICRSAAGPKLKLPALQFASLHYVVAGRGTLLIDARAPIALDTGSVVILPAGLAHELVGDGDEDAALAAARRCQPAALGMDEISSDGDGGIVLACSAINATYQRTRGLFDYLDEPIVSPMRAGDPLAGTLDSMLAEMADPGPGSASLVALLMKQCLIHVLRTYCDSGHCRVPWLGALEDARLALALECMLDEPGRRYTLELLAATAGMSRSAFAQHFRDAFGRSAMDFLKELRLQRAAHLLRTTRRPVKSIAEQVGFDSRSHFSRSFSDYFGSAPAEFRSPRAPAADRNGRTGKPL
jgi:AraC family transcriptional activator of mtrCDE